MRYVSKSICSVSLSHTYIASEMKSKKKKNAKNICLRADRDLVFDYIRRRFNDTNASLYRVLFHFIPIYQSVDFIPILFVLVGRFMMTLRL